MDNMINAGSFGLQSGTAQKTVGQYLFDCLKLQGITEIFGVAGDYNFTLLDTLECYNGIRFIEGRNELNSGYAAKRKFLYFSYCFYFCGGHFTNI
ncbi:hypothetical protein BHU24_21110 [Bacillus pseudomycoides]|nr:hypothetical protein [Bacillus pseudomycoides]